MAQDEYERLLQFRLGVRRFLHWSEQQAEEAGLTTAQHQLLLVIRGNSERTGPTIGQISEALLLRHHSAVELVDRAEQADLVQRRKDTKDGRVVRVVLTRHGRATLERLTERHLDELQLLAPALEALLVALGKVDAAEHEKDRAEIRRSRWHNVS